MRFERKIGLVLVCMVAPYVCAVFAFVLYMQRHPGPVPRWMSLSMLCAMILTFVVGGAVLPRIVKKQAARESIEEAKQRRARASKGLKAGLVLYVLILLNGIRLVAQDSLPWDYAIPGLAVDLILIAVFAFSLKRLRQSKSTGPNSDTNPISSK